MTEQPMTANDYRRGHLMVSAVFRSLTDAEREELVSLLGSTAEPAVPDVTGTVQACTPPSPGAPNAK